MSLNLTAKSITAGRVVIAQYLLKIGSAIEKEFRWGCRIQDRWRDGKITQRQRGVSLAHSKRLVLLLTIAVTWVMKTSLMFNEKSSVAAHGLRRRSVFRNGFDKLRRSLIHPLEEGLKELCHYIYLLRDPKCPKDLKTFRPAWSASLLFFAWISRRLI